MTLRLKLVCQTYLSHKRHNNSISNSSISLFQNATCFNLFIIGKNLLIQAEPIKMSLFSGFKKFCLREFPGGLVVRTRSSHCQGSGSDPCLGNWNTASCMARPIQIKSAASSVKDKGLIGKTSNNVHQPKDNLHITQIGVPVPVLSRDKSLTNLN